MFIEDLSRQCQGCQYNIPQ